MRKGFLAGGALALAIGVLAWESRRERPEFDGAAPLHLARVKSAPELMTPGQYSECSVHGEDAAYVQAELLPMPRQLPVDDDEPVEVIDLTLLQKPGAGTATETPAPQELPIALDVPVLAKKKPAEPAPFVADFIPHSADGNAVQQASMRVTTGDFWQKLSTFVRIIRARQETVEPPLFVPMPLPVPQRMSSYHQQHPGCPYTGGCPYDGGQYRQIAKAKLPGTVHRCDLTWTWMFGPY